MGALLLQRESDEHDVGDVDFDPEAGAVAHQLLHPLPDFGDQKRIFKRDALPTGAFTELLEGLLVETNDFSDVVLKFRFHAASPLFKGGWC